MGLETELTIYNMAQPYLMAIFSAVITFGAAWFWFTRNRETATAKAIADRLAALESKAAVTEQAIMPISTAFQAILIKQLTHYHTPELDALLAKLDPYTLSDEEEVRFYHLLEERTRDMGSAIDESERNAAKMLPFVIKRIKEETDLASKVALQIVVVPTHTEEPTTAAANTVVSEAAAVEAGASPASDDLGESKKPEGDPIR